MKLVALELRYTISVIRNNSVTTWWVVRGQSQWWCCSATAINLEYCSAPPNTKILEYCPGPLCLEWWAASRRWSQCTDGSIRTDGHWSEWRGWGLTRVHRVLGGLGLIKGNMKKAFIWPTPPGTRCEARRRGRRLPILERVWKRLPDITKLYLCWLCDVRKFLPVPMSLIEARRWSLL